MTTPDGLLNQRQRRQMARAPVVGTVFDPYERLFRSFDGGTVFDYGTAEARDLKNMLKRDGQARSLEQVLTLPLRGAPHEMRAADGDRGELQLVHEVLDDKLPTLLQQMTAAIVYRKAFFEKDWALDGRNVVYNELAWRPPQTCEAGFDPKTGRPSGFRQRISGLDMSKRTQNPNQPGYVTIEPPNAFVHTHGRHRDPLYGISDLDVAYWAYETQQKVLFLWFQFLENQSLPKVLAYGDDPNSAEENADAMASLKSSGVLGLTRPQDPSARTFDVLESSGQGAGQFLEAIRYLDSQMTRSVLATFTDLPDAAGQGRGSYALSADQSEFFLQSRQAVADEMAHSVVEGVIRPLVTYNFGPDAAMPSLTIGPVSNRDAARAMDLLRSVITAERINVPSSFLDQLITRTASYLELDAEQVDRALRERTETVGELQQTVEAVGSATELVQRANAGENPERMILELIPEYESNGHAGVELTKPDVGTSTMVALYPSHKVAEKLTVKDGIPADELHITLAFLGKDLSSAQRHDALRAVKYAAAQHSSLSGGVGGLGQFTDNGDGTPYYAPVDVPGLEKLRESVVDALKDTGVPVATDHGFTPHLTVKYAGRRPAIVPWTEVAFNEVALVTGDTERNVVKLSG